MDEMNFEQWIKPLWFYFFQNKIVVLEMKIFTNKIQMEQ
jgi:hypothetical protein